MRRKGAKGTAANKLNLMLFHLKKVTDSDNHLISLVILAGVAGRLVKSDREAKWLEAAKVTKVEVRIRFLRFSRFPKQDHLSTVGYAHCGFYHWDSCKEKVDGSQI